MSEMRAVVYYGKGDIRYEKVALPRCGENEIRVKVDACAVCGSDEKSYLNGNPRMKPPIVMGHEFTGLIECIGREVQGFTIGERVVMATSVSCGQCYYCKKGWSNLCSELRPMGFFFPGGMAEYVVIPEPAIRNGHVVKVREKMAPEHAALAEPTSCAINCAENLGIRSGETVVIVGAGPLGILNLYVAKSYGAGKVLLVQREGKRFQRAREFACDRLINSSQEDPVTLVRSETDGVGADCVVVTAPDPSVQEHALELVRKRGRICLFASLPAGKSMLSLDSRVIHYGELQVVGASDSTAAQVKKALSLIASPGFPKEKIATPILPMHEVSQAFRIMKDRDGMRVVLKP